MNGGAMENLELLKSTFTRIGVTYVVVSNEEAGGQVVTITGQHESTRLRVSFHFDKDGKFKRTEIWM